MRSEHREPCPFRGGGKPRIVTNHGLEIGQQGECGGEMNRIERPSALGSQARCALEDRIVHSNQAHSRENLLRTLHPGRTKPSSRYRSQHFDPSQGARGDLRSILQQREHRRGLRLVTHHLHQR